MADNLKLLLSILLDKTAQKDAERGLDSMARKIEGLDDAQLDQLLDEFDTVLTKIEEANEKLADTKRQIEQLNKVAGTIGRIGTGLAAFGGATIGAYALSAKNYVKFIEEAGIKNDEVANRWLAATKRIENAQLNIGQATATALLPYLEQAAELIERVANAVQQNPEAVKGLLNLAGAASIMGAIAIAVSKGMKIYADTLYMAALADHSLAMRQFIAGVATSNVVGGAGGEAGAVGAVGKTLGTVTLIASSVIIGAELGSILGNAIAEQIYGEGYKKQGINDVLLTAFRLPNVPFALLVQNLEKMGGVVGEFGDMAGDNLTKIDQFMQKLLGVNQAANDATGTTRDFAAEAEAAAMAAEKAAQASQDYSSALQIVANLAAENAQAEAKLRSDLAKVSADAQRAYGAAARKLKDALAKIKTTLSANLAQLASDYAAGNLKAEQDYQEQRAAIIQTANENVRQIREDANEQLRQLEQDHNDRMYDLAIARDALGIIQENRRFDREKSELARSTQKQIAETRRQAQIQLAEQRKAFLQQQAERRAEYLAQIQEERAQAEQSKKEAQAAYASEAAMIRQQAAERAATLRQQYNDERLQREQAARAQLADLGYLLQNEQLVRRQGYTAIIGDARAFVAEYQAALRMSNAGSMVSQKLTANTVAMKSYYPANPYPLRQMGGYGPGFVERGDEFILNPTTTRMAEAMLGKRLSQANVIAALSVGRGNITLNDQRRFYGGISPAEKRMIDESTREQVAYLLGG